MPKLIFPLLLILLVAGGYYIYSNNIGVKDVVQDPRLTIAQGDILEFDGTLADFITDCEFDGECIAYVDEYTIIVGAGESPKPVARGKLDVWKTDIGKEVKVRAKVIIGKQLTIYGSDDLYVLKK